MQRLLTATVGRVEFWPLQYWNHWIDCHKIWHSWLGLRDDLTRQSWWLRETGGRQWGDCVKYNVLWLFLIYSFVYFFSQARVQIRPFNWFWRIIGPSSKDMESSNGQNIYFSNLTPVSPENVKIWPKIGNFRPKCWSVKVQVYQKVLNQSTRKFNIMLGTQTRVPEYTALMALATKSYSMIILAFWANIAYSTAVWRTGIQISKRWSPPTKLLYVEPG